MQHKNTLMTTLAITALMLSIGAQATVGEWLNEKVNLVEKLIGENTEGTTQHRTSPDLTQLRPTPHQNVAVSFMAVVVRVSDGDTIEVLQDKKPVRVRLANIDAPEKKQPFGRWSTNQLKALLAGQTVTVNYRQTDRYGRILGRVVTANGTEANRQQVITGAAWVYERYNTDKALPALQREAQMQKRGLWADSQPVPPWEWRHKNKE